jgi:hypothetical protein
MRGLLKLHRHKIGHKDLSPGNLFVEGMQLDPDSGEIVDITVVSKLLYLIKIFIGGYEIPSQGVFGVADHEFGISFPIQDVFTKILATCTKIMR